MKKQNVRTLSLIVATFTYLLIGAAVFDVIESEEEKRQKEALEYTYSQVRLRFNISDEDFNLLEEIVPLDQPYKAGKPWKFAGSFYYATTVLTTIGYGHSTPKTPGGKFFTMVYAIVGIPLGLVMFNSIGERLNNFTSLVVNKVRKFSKSQQTDATEMDLIFVVSAISGIVTTTGAAVFSHYEGWSYFNSMYYCFITLTTIGFGDFVALQQEHFLEKKPEYVTFALFFIMFGLAIIAASLNLMVLKFMTMNTEDEKRDEQEAEKAAAQNVRLEGDIILQQNDILHWQAEGACSMDDLQSVCSCACDSCLYNPFRPKDSSRNFNECTENRDVDENQATHATSSKALRWYSTDSLKTTDPPGPSRERLYATNNNSHNKTTSRKPSKLKQKKRVESVQDVRKFEPHIPLARLRSSAHIRAESRPRKQLLVTRLPHHQLTEHESGTSSWSVKKFLRRKIFGADESAETDSSPKRECFVLEELACVEVVPVEDNHFERASF